jgi:predicted ester cyclase
MNHEWLEGTRGPYRNLVDYILGITHEIWESRSLERIYDYYSRDCTIYTLGGIVRGADAVVQNTRDTLIAFPDRWLLGDAVIWRHEAPGKFYSSHRISSPMTNRGTSSIGPATDRQVRVSTIADCYVENGVITREWLVRDNFSLVQQLGFDVHEVAQRQAAQPLAPEFRAWLASETERVRREAIPLRSTSSVWSPQSAHEFASTVLAQHWRVGNAAAIEVLLAPYVVLYDSRAIATGRRDVANHYAAWRTALANVRVSLDHLCVLPDGVDGHQVAARWTLIGDQAGEIDGTAPRGAPLLILGVTHWQVVAGRVAAEWTIFDRLALLTQIYRHAAL